MLNLSETVAIIDGIIAEKPEGYRYTTDPKTEQRRAQYPKEEKAGTDCYYAHADGSAGCIVGNFVNKLKPEFELREHEFEGVSTILYYAGIKVSSDASQFLSDLQNFQDKGETWKSAKEGALDRNPGVLSL